MLTLLVATVLMNPFLPGLALDAGPGEVEAALFENGWTTQWYGLLLRGENNGAVLDFYWNEDEEEPVTIRYAEPHPPDETRTDAYGAWLDKLKETFGEPEVVDSFHHWETGGYVVDIAAEEFDFGDGYPTPVVLITIQKLP
jgi:hypothetical protein